MAQGDLELLQTVPAHHLQTVMKARRVPVDVKTPASDSSPGTTSAASAEAARHLFASSSISAALGDLADLDQLILRELVACGGRANSRDLALYFTSANLLAPTQKETEHDPLRGYVTTPLYPTAHPHGIFEQALRRLLILGLLFWGKQTNFSGRDYTSGIHDGVVIVPPSVIAVVQSTWQPVAGAPVPSDASPGSPGIHVGEAALALQRSLYLYWSLVAGLRDGLGLLNNGLLTRSALRQVADHMSGKGSLEPLRQESDVPRLLFIRLLLMQLGLLQERRNALYTLPAEPFFAQPILERVRLCYHLYLETPFWNELLYLPEVNVRPGPAPLDPAHEEVMRARQVVIERLTHEQVSEWCDISAFIARTKLYSPYLLFPRQYGPRAERYSSTSNPYGWDFRLRRGWLTHREGWHMVEGGFIRAIIAGPLSWLGLLNLDRAENPTRFLLGPGAAIITSATLSTDEQLSWGRLIVQPNFELVALAPVSEVLLISLDRFAERISLEHIAQYRLTRASVTRAIQRGLHAETIQAELERAAGGEIPQNVRYSLGEWERQARRIEIWPGATLLEVDDETLLDQLFAAPETRIFFGRRLAPRLVEVAPQHLPAVQQALWQRDYLPTLTPAPTQNGISENGHLVTREPQWRLHDNGLLQPLYAVLDLYLAAEVERFSERDEASGWLRITASSIQKALTNNIALDHITHVLHQYSEGGIPNSLLIRFKLWGGGYGTHNDIHIEHAPLLRLSDQILQDLQADADLTHLLSPPLETHSRLVRIEAHNLDRVIELLRARGFTIE